MKSISRYRSPLPTPRIPRRITASVRTMAPGGGTTERDSKQVHLCRQDDQGQTQTAVIDLQVHANPSEQVTDNKAAALVNMPVQAGDVVNVPQAGMYFVDGAVRKPG